jgi:hypothetical protein
LCRVRINDKLPAVSRIIPTSFPSEHPDYIPVAGAAFGASKIDAIAANPKVWAKTVFVLNYDENDGLFDHVAPPVPPPGTAHEFINRYQISPPNASRVSSPRIPDQKRWFGCVLPRSQFFNVPMLTPSFVANPPLERLVFVRYLVSNSTNELVLFWQGFESTLTALITRWQKGFRNHPFRHTNIN